MDKEKMPKYVIAKCPYDGYVWHSRLLDIDEVEHPLKEGPERAAEP